MGQERHNCWEYIQKVEEDVGKDLGREIQYEYGPDVAGISRDSYQTKGHFQHITEVDVLLTRIVSSLTEFAASGTRAFKLKLEA